MKTKPNWDKDTTLVNMLPALLDMCKCFQYHHCYKGCQIGVAAPQPGAPPTSSASQPPVNKTENIEVAGVGGRGGSL